MTHGFNLVCRCPAMSAPTGMQIVARPFDDLRVFRAASGYEQARPWRRKRPAL